MKKKRHFISNQSSQHWFPKEILLIGNICWVRVRVKENYHNLNRLLIILCLQLKCFVRQKKAICISSAKLLEKNRQIKYFQIMNVAYVNKKRVMCLPKTMQRSCSIFSFLSSTYIWYILLIVNGFAHSNMLHVIWERELCSNVLWV